MIFQNPVSARDAQLNVRGPRTFVPGIWPSDQGLDQISTNQNEFVLWHQFPNSNVAIFRKTAMSATKI